ncbi:MAG: MFS transporter [Caulobacteraceae bacterium]|nr:MFS transporter [Caulobacteraceae bacterium]
MTSPSLQPDSGSAGLLRHRGYLLLLASRFLGVIGGQAQTVTIAWQVYALARLHGGVRQSAFALGLIGLAQFLPVVLLTLAAGETADRHDRRRIAVICMIGEAATACALLGLALAGVTYVSPLYGVAFAFGACRAFLNPAGAALGPMLVPRELLPRAIAWNSLAFQAGAILGPVVGGALVAISPKASYTASLALYLISALALTLIRGDTRPVVQAGSRWTLVKEGLAYVWNNKIVFGAISLDLFAVLLGGATALLPVFAADVLHVSATGFGVLKAASAAGAAIVAVMLAARPIRSHAGVVMFCGVATFGAATIVFALSKSLLLSVAALAVLGGADMLSVFVRQSLVQIVTPDAMRGRVAAVSTLFIGASNELGEFESGLAARFLGPIGATVFGGVGALVVTGSWAGVFPALRKADQLS